MGIVVGLLLLSMSGPRLRELPLQAFGLSDDGKTVVGYIEKRRAKTKRRLPCYWTRRGGMKRLDLGGFENGEARSASADGKSIVGLVDRGGKSKIALWSGGSPARIIAEVDSPWGMAEGSPGISGDGKWVVGSTGGRAFKWSEKTGVQFLQSLDRQLPKTAAVAISVDGSTTIGQSNRGPIPSQVKAAQLMPSSFDLRGTDSYEACAWKGATPSPLGMPSGCLWTQAISVSRDGTVVAGNAMPQAVSHPFIWSQERGYRYLPSLPRSSSVLTGMCSDGRLAYGFGSPDNRNLPIMAPIWIDGQVMRLDAYLRSKGISVPRDWSLDFVRGVSGDERILAGDAYSGDRAFSWIVE